MKYRAGLPGWKLFARLGGTVLVRVQVRRDEESGVYTARSPDLDGLIVEAPTLDALRDEVHSAMIELFELALAGKQAHAKADIHVQDTVFCAA